VHDYAKSHTQVFISWVRVRVRLRVTVLGLGLGIVLGLVLGLGLGLIIPTSRANIILRVGNSTDLARHRLNQLTPGITTSVATLGKFFLASALVYSGFELVTIESLIRFFIN